MNELSLHSVRRRFPYHGPLSSAELTEMVEAMVHDLAAIIDSLNRWVVPLVRSLPNGSRPPTAAERQGIVDPVVNGLDGSQLFVDATTTETDNPLLYNRLQERPATIREALEHLSQQIRQLQR